MHTKAGELVGLVSLSVSFTSETHPIPPVFLKLPRGRGCWLD